MAQIGLRHFTYSVITDGKYTGANKLSGAINCKPSLTIAEATLYADDTVAESAKEFVKGTLSLTTADDDDTVFAGLLGHSVDSTSKEVIKAVDDVAPYVGFGRVVVRIVNNVKKYRAEFFPKVQFKDYQTEGKTKGENIEFATPTIEGTIFAHEETINTVAKLVWEHHKTFDSDAEAQTYLTDLMKVSS